MKRYRYEILSGFTGTTTFQVPIFLEASVDEMGIMSGFDGDFEQIEQFANFTYKSIPPASPSVSPSVSPSITPSITVTPSVSPSFDPTPTPSISVTPSITPSITPTPSTTPIPSITPSITPTPSLTPTPTRAPLYYSHRRSNSPNSVKCSLCPISFGSGFFYTSPSDNIPTIGMTVYQDSDLTTPFNGGGLWWGIEWDGFSPSSIDLLQIDTDGEVLGTGICSVDCP